MPSFISLASITFTHMKKMYIFGLLLSLSTAAQAQLKFEKIIGETDGEDVGRSVIKTNDGHYVMAGKKEANNNIDIFLLKTSTDGTTVWEKTFGSSEEEDAYAVLELADGGFMVLGYDYGAGTMFYRTDASGNLLWSKTVTSPVKCFDFVRTPDNGFALIGEHTGFFADYLIYLIRTNSDGDTLWTRQFGQGNNVNTPYSLALTTDGGFVLTGETTSPPTAGENDIFLIRTDANGNQLWDKRFGTPALIEQGYSVLPTSDGGFLVGGTTIDVLFSSSSGFLIKTDANGDTLWTRTYDFSKDYLFNQIEDVVLTADGGYALCGWAGDFSGDIFGFIHRTDTLGAVVQTRQYYGAGICTLRSVALSDDGELVATGFTQGSLLGLPDIYLLKTNDVVLSTTKPIEPFASISPNPAKRGHHWQITLAETPSLAERRWTLTDLNGKTAWQLNTTATQVNIPVPQAGNTFVLTLISHTGKTVSRKLLSVD